MGERGGTIRRMTNDLPALPDPGLRVSGAERQKAIAVLREAAADERITFDELEARLPGALQAKDRSALYRILGDLVPAARLGTMFDGAVVESDAPGMSWEHPLLIETDWKGFTQDGLWEVPPFLEVLGSGYGTVTLDLTRATPLAPVIDIVLTGNPVVKILVPEGWGGADLQQLNVVQQGDSGTRARSTVPTRPQEGQPRLIFRGAFAGNVTVRVPNGWDRFLRRRKAGQQERH